MTDLSVRERLQPALLDRLSDDAPDDKQESREMRTISQQKLRAAVLRDLTWLFNAIRPSDRIDWESAPEAERSVINFGLPPLSGETASTLNIVELESRIRRAIVDFEPRIDPSSIRVQAILSEVALNQHNQIQLEIHGDLWSQPIPIELLLHTEFDLETGQVQIRDLA